MKINQIGNIYKEVVEMQLRGKKSSKVMTQQGEIFQTYLENIHKKYKPSKPQDGEGNISGYDSEQDRIEYEKLEMLLKQTADMNAIKSAGQLKMHKKDINDRFRSLAFKMEKVYNMNKPKGYGHEVYKFFKEVVIDDPLLE